MTELKIAIPTVELQAASQDIWDKKYRLYDKTGQVVDEDISATSERVALAIAQVESPKKRDKWHKKFVWALQNGAIPAGRIIANAGAGKYKPATSTINCTVSGVIPDTMHGILEKNLEAGLTLKAGCGIGYEFSTLRPRGAFVSGSGAQTSGPLSFMEIFDKMCSTVSSAGGRRGAQMATFDIRHPDVLDFIRAKREDGRLRQFNLSLLINDEFIQAVKSESDWVLSFPVSPSDVEAFDLDLMDTTAVIWRGVPGSKDQPKYIKDDEGLVACRIYKTLPAKRVWDVIMASTYDFAEPGFILIDRVNKQNNLWFCEDIRATNPCGEQPLPPYGSCLLGSINLTLFVDNAFTEAAKFNWDKYRDVVSIFTRMLDNVVDINGLALPQQREEIENKRRHGMGYLGLGSALAMLRIVYGSPKSTAFTEQVSKELALTGWRTGVQLAQEKGCAPALTLEYAVTEKMLRDRPELIEDGVRVGDSLSGKVLLAKYSQYMQRVGEEAPDLIDDICKHGCRFTHHSSIAPTGTISLSLANNASNGIEPSFAHQYSRNIIRQGKKTKEKVDVFSYELLAYRELIDSKATTETLPDYFVGSDSVTPSQHVDVQAAAQKWIDSSISKTINVPTDIPYEEFKDIYLYAYEQGLKGCTTFRFNPEAFQGVLVREEDLEATVYCFDTDDGKSIELLGNEQVEYDGEQHTAANLYDALKEGYYGRL